MRSASPVIVKSLESLQAMLAADGYELGVGEEGTGTLVLQITAGPEACEDCLVPKPLMRTYFEEALRPVCEFGLPEIRLVYPGDPE